MMSIRQYNAGEETGSSEKTVSPELNRAPPDRAYELDKTERI